MKPAVVLAVALAGCANLHSHPPPVSLPRTEIYQRATNHFSVADFFKPAEARTNDLPFTLAPLILQEVAGPTDPPLPPDRFGTLSLSNSVPILDPSRPVIYWHADTVTLSGKAHTRIAYLWFYSPEGTKPGLPLQGIRLTLSSAGQPVIWEVLADSTGAELIFVSQNLEAAAAAQFGRPLPERRCAIERSLQEAPNVIVARVVDDGPVAMGPIVYLGAGARDVSTVICRCMPAQAKTLRTTTAHDLLPLPALPANSLLPQARERTKARPAFWPGDDPAGYRLEKCLRLPAF